MVGVPVVFASQKARACRQRLSLKFNFSARAIHWYCVSGTVHIVHQLYNKMRQ